MDNFDAEIVVSSSLNWTLYIVVGGLLCIWFFGFCFAGRKVKEVKQHGKRQQSRSVREVYHTSRRIQRYDSKVTANSPR